MDRQTLGVGLKALGFLAICFLAHYAIISFTDLGNSLPVLGYSLFGFYGLGLIFTIVIFAAMVGIKNSLPNNLGFVFLGFITLRLVVSYLFAKAGLDSENVDLGFKVNFLVSVLVFLGGDAYLSYFVLNKNSSAEKS